MSQTEFSFVMGVPRWQYNQLMAHMFNAASQYGITLDHRTFKGLLRTEISWTVTGEQSRVAQFCGWVNELVKLNQ